MSINRKFVRFPFLLLLLLLVSPCVEGEEFVFSVPDIPDPLIVETYKQAAEKNVIACVNPKVFPGYWSVCADGRGFGYGNSYPSLDGYQIADALVRLGGFETLRLNWDYVRSFQRADGCLPLAILPKSAGKTLRYDTPVDPNGGLYKHWVPGNPLDTLAPSTYIANAVLLYAAGQDRDWLAAQIESINRSADYLARLVTEEGRVRGAGYYIERPTRIETDGVAQCHAIDAFRKAAALNSVLDRKKDAERYAKLAEKMRRYFVETFWFENKFAEYYHPERGFIMKHGLTDTDWAAIALNVATKEQKEILYPQLVRDKGFLYGTMPSGISTQPNTYEDWEFAHPDRYDLGAMGRVWFLTAAAQATMRDSGAIIDGLHAVAEQGKKNGFYWHERYHPSDDGENRPAGPLTYCEYPANFIRIVQRFLLGVEINIDGSLILAPTVPEEYWAQGFGQEIRLPGRTLNYRCSSDRIGGKWSGKKEQPLAVRMKNPIIDAAKCSVSADGKELPVRQESDLLYFTLPQSERPIDWMLIIGAQQ